MIAISYTDGETYWLTKTGGWAHVGDAGDLDDRLVKFDNHVDAAIAIQAVRDRAATKMPGTFRVEYTGRPPTQDETDEGYAERDCTTPRRRPHDQV